MLTKCLQPIMHLKSHVLHASTTFFARPNEAGVFRPSRVYGNAECIECWGGADMSPAHGMFSPAKDIYPLLCLAKDLFS